MNSKNALTYIDLKAERVLLNRWEHFFIILLHVLRQDKINGISCGNWKSRIV